MLDGKSQVPVEENNEPEKQPVASHSQMVRQIFFQIQGCEKCVVVYLYNNSFRTMPFHGHLEAPRKCIPIKHTSRNIVKRPMYISINQFGPSIELLLLILDINQLGTSFFVQLFFCCKPPKHKLIVWLRRPSNATCSKGSDLSSKQRGMAEDCFSAQNNSATTSKQNIYSADC